MATGHKQSSNRTTGEPHAADRDLELAGVDIHVITAASLRLDRQAHRAQLLETAKRLRPRLLLLDPLVRLHGLDEICDPSHRSSHVTTTVM